MKTDTYFNKLRLLQIDCDDSCTAQTRLQAHLDLEQLLIGERWVLERAADEEEERGKSNRIMTLGFVEDALEAFIARRDARRDDNDCAVFETVKSRAHKKAQDKEFSDHFRDFLRRKLKSFPNKGQSITCAEVRANQPTL